MRVPRRPYCVVVLAALVGLAGMGAAASTTSRAAESYQAITLYAEAMSIVHDNYVDELSWPTLVQAGIRGAVQGLDADSTVLASGQAHAGADDGARPAKAAGEVGLALSRRDGGLSVIAARDGTPAQSAGLRSGDRILTIGGAQAQDMTVAEAAGRLLGRPGSRVTLTVARRGWSEPQTFALTRVERPASALTDRRLGDGILYVRMPVLDATTAGELKRLLDSTSPERASGLVLDLRNTLDGSIQAVPAIASLFLAPGCVVARVESRAPEQSPELLTVPATTRWTRPLAILVSQGTDSAAEVLAGAMQDTGRAVIVGSPTFGDASRQSVIPLSDGSALSLTTARYLTPKGHAITGHGIAPDMVAKAPAPRTAADSAAAAATDAELELAHDVVKAAGILGHGSSGGSESARVEAALGRCMAPAA